MRRIGLFVLFVMGLLLATAGHATAGGDPFIGGWRSVDTDGSQQSLQVEPLGAGYNAAYYRDSFTSGVCQGAPAKIWSRMRVNGNVMKGSSADLRCPNNIHFHLGAGRYIYDPGTDTLVDGAGIVWTRVT
jgi:hypothetical protein